MGLTVHLLCSLCIALSVWCAAGLQVSCKAAVPDPIDVSPIRSPQQVHTQLLPHFRNKDVVEIGTRTGDGAACFARVARSLTAVEADIKYCLPLERRVQALRLPNFTVACRPYQDGLPDGDVYTWWQQHPDLVNEEVLPPAILLLCLRRHSSAFPPCLLPAIVCLISATCWPLPSPALLLATPRPSLIGTPGNLCVGSFLRTNSLVYGPDKGVVCTFSLVYRPEKGARTNSLV